MLKLDHVASTSYDDTQDSDFDNYMYKLHAPDRCIQSIYQARTQLFRRGVHFKLEQTSCQQSLKYISLYNTEVSPFSTEERNIFLCT